MAYKGGARARVGRVGDLATRAAAAGWMGKLGVDGGGNWRRLGSRGTGKGVGHPRRILMGEEGRLFRWTKKWGLRERGEVERENGKLVKWG